MSVCLFVCLFVPQLLRNGWTDWAAILKEEFPWCADGFGLKNLLGNTRRGGDEINVFLLTRYVQIQIFHTLPFRLESWKLNDSVWYNI